MTSSAPASVSSSASAASSAASSSSRAASSSSRPSSTSSQSSIYVYSSVTSSVSLQSTVYSTNAVVLTTQADGQTSQITQVTVIQTVVPATTVYGTTVVSTTESPTGIAGLQAQGLSGDGSGGLSTGAKAGIGAGVGVAVVAAAIIGAVYAMRRRKQNHIAEEDRYPPSSVPSFYGGVGGLGKTPSRYTESEMGGRSPPMREADPMARYANPGASTQRTTLPPGSRTSDISSVSGSEPTTYRPGPGMGAITEQQPSQRHSELPDQDVPRPQHHDYIVPAAGYTDTAGNPFHEKSGGDTPSLYSEDGANEGGVARHPSHHQTGSPALELPGESTAGGSSTLIGSEQGYRGMDQEQPLHTRSQMQKSPPRMFDPSHNF
ncbi:hypothetical protein LTS08_006050 [Lithohypha guttulata]|nr:hypothetical protein LTS08_006050 [Lithohypha guttulata]